MSSDSIVASDRSNDLFDLQKRNKNSVTELNSKRGEFTIERLRREANARGNYPNAFDWRDASSYDLRTFSKHTLMKTLPSDEKLMPELLHLPRQTALVNVNARCIL